MKRFLPFLAASLLTAHPAFAGRTIAWISDQLVQNAGSDATDNDGGPDCRFSAGAGPYADEAFITLLRSAGFTVVRCNPPNSPNALTPADIGTLNTFDLVILGRGTGSGAFDTAAETFAWNSSITKPLLCTNTYLSRSNRLGWFSSSAPPVQPDQLLNPLTFTAIADPVQAYLATGVALTGDTTNDTITEIINYPTTPPNNGAADIRGISLLTGSTINAGGTVHATSLNVPDGLTSPYIASLPAGTILAVNNGTAANPAQLGPANGQELGGYRLQFLAGIRESATSPNNGVRNAGFESFTPVGERMFLRAVALAMNSGAVPADADDDGLPDAWETTHFLTPAATTGLADDDGDGLVNLIEYAFNLKPTVSDISGLAYSTAVGGLVEISITKRPYCCHVIETSTDLLNWTADDPGNDGDGLVTIVNDASTLYVRETAPLARRQFRVRVYPMPL
ncbi:MAG: hypothetical protein KA004_18555 [Verrucomicrobiales bacterium]|nr:hypothetical protein [Verrucomicrobiales bacterium]